MNEELSTASGVKEVYKVNDGFLAMVVNSEILLLYYYSGDYCIPLRDYA